jgi:centromeric protein E
MSQRRISSKRWPNPSFQKRLMASRYSSTVKRHRAKRTQNGCESAPGVIELAVQEIFEQIEDLADREFRLRVTYIEINNEKIDDLLGEGKNLMVRHTDSCVDSEEFDCTTPEEILEYFVKGSNKRNTKKTKKKMKTPADRTTFFGSQSSRR